MVLMLLNMATPAITSSVSFAKNRACEGKTFIQDYSEKGRLPETKQQIIEMTLNGSGIRDIARVLNISPATVINELKNSNCTP